MVDTTFKFRTPAELLASFQTACNDNDQSAAQVLRAAMRSYIAENAQPQRDLLAPARSKRK